jgi:F-box protein 20
VIEALELALQEIDSEHTQSNTNENTFIEFEGQTSVKHNSNMQNSATPTVKPQPIYENIEEIEESITLSKQNYQVATAPEPQQQVVAEEESHYQVPKPAEPYYEVPKKIKPIHVYENVDIFYNGNIENATLPIISDDDTTSPLLITTKTFMEPPKEKPPPPPVEEITDGEGGNETDEETEQLLLQPTQQKHTVDNFKRINSTKRIKKEIRNKRSSFLGIEGSVDDDNLLELSLAPPPDMAALLKEEKRLEKQMFMKVGFCDNSDTGT